MTSPAAVFSAWQAALATEQQAVFGYGLLGPHLSTAGDRSRAWADELAHRALLTSTSAALAAAKLTPVEPQADYPALYPVTSVPAARLLAIRLEQDCAAAWRFLYATLAEPVPPNAGSSAPDLRAAAQTNLTASAVRALRWRRAAGISPATVPFPGLSGD